MSEGQSRTQKIAHTIKVMLVLLDMFKTHPLSRQQSLVAWRITRRGHEFKVPMATTEEEPSPKETKTK